MKKILALFLVILTVVSIASCGESVPNSTTENTTEKEIISTTNSSTELVTTTIKVESTTTNSTTTQEPIKPVEKLNSYFYSLEFNGDDHFEEFLKVGAESDLELVKFLKGLINNNSTTMIDGGMNFACSTISSFTPNGEKTFGRNFDWDHCMGYVVKSNPTNGYKSISTINGTFFSVLGLPFNILKDEYKALLANYAPLDGMNEKGVAVSVNMVTDNETINQNTGKIILTTTTAIRLILNKADSVDSALELLRQYDIHESLKLNVHFVITDRSGKSVVVEFIKNQMVVNETDVVTNFYIAPEKNELNINDKDHGRFNSLKNSLKKGTLTMEDVRDALEGASKKNFRDGSYTEWSVIYNQTTGEVRYYHRENYLTEYVFNLEMSK